MFSSLLQTSYLNEFKMFISQKCFLLPEIINNPVKSFTVKFKQETLIIQSELKYGVHQ